MWGLQAHLDTLVNRPSLMLCSRATTTNGKVAIATSVMPGPKPLIFLYHSKHSQADQDQASHGFVI
jgi:hypothetical protein